MSNADDAEIRRQAIALALGLVAHAKMRASGGSVHRAEGGPADEPLTNMERQAISRRAMYGRDPTPDEVAKLAADMPRLEANSKRLWEASGVPEAGRSINAAWDDPSLANLTSAGVHSLLAAWQPAKAIKVGALGLAEALRRDWNASPVDSAEAQSRTKSAPTSANGYSKQELDDLSSATGVSPAVLATMTRRRIQEMVVNQANTRSSSDQTVTEQSSLNREAERKRAVMAAEDERTRILARDKRFSDTEMGKMYDKLGPAMVSAIGGGAMGLASKAATPGGKALYDYVLPGALGAAAGAKAFNAPLEYNAFSTEPDNQRRLAWQTYAQMLPEDDPRKAKVLQEVERGDYGPEKNPLQQISLGEYKDGLVSRSIYGGLAGVTGGILGAEAAKIPGRLVEGVAALPGRARESYYNAMARGDAAKAKALNIADDVAKPSRIRAEAEQVGRQKQQQLDEAEKLATGAGKSPRETLPAGFSEPQGSENLGRSVVDRILAGRDRMKDLNPARSTEVTANPPGTLVTPPKTQSETAVVRVPPLTKNRHDMMEDVSKTLVGGGKPAADWTAADYQNIAGKVNPALIDKHIGEWRAIEKMLEAGGNKNPTAKQIIDAYQEVKPSGIQAVPKRAMGGSIEPEVKHHSHMQPRADDGTFNGPPKAPAPPVMQATFAKGGMIRKGVELARRFADGGAVLAGPVVGETGGRTDALPVDVEAGSFVVPADCVAALGEGNTLAGTKALDEQFGASRPRMAAGGKPVPIKISDGEYVVAPEMVRRIGGGDMDRGHQMLDQFVKQTRARHIATLQNLAPPAR